MKLGGGISSENGTCEEISGHDSTQAVWIVIVSHNHQLMLAHCWMEKEATHFNMICIPQPVSLQSKLMLSAISCKFSSRLR